MAYGYYYYDQSNHRALSENVLQGGYDSPHIAYVDMLGRPLINMGLLLGPAVDDTWGVEQGGGSAQPLERVSEEQTGLSHPYNRLRRFTPRDSKGGLVGSHNHRHLHRGPSLRHNIVPLSAFTNSLSGEIGKWEYKMAKVVTEHFYKDKDKVTNGHYTKYMMCLIWSEYNIDHIKPRLMSDASWDRLMTPVYGETNHRALCMEYFNNLAKWVPIAQRRIPIELALNSTDQRIEWYIHDNLFCHITIDEILHGCGSIGAPRWVIPNDISWEEVWKLVCAETKLDIPTGHAYQYKNRGESSDPDTDKNCLDALIPDNINILNSLFGGTVAAHEMTNHIRSVLFNQNGVGWFDGGGTSGRTEMEIDSLTEEATRLTGRAVNVSEKRRLRSDDG